MLKSFLVPVDGSEYSSGAVGYAAALARKKGGRITLLFVIDVRSLEGPFLADLSGSIGITPFLDFQEKVRSLLEDKASVVLDTHAAELKKDGLECSVRTETGIVGRVICQEAMEHDAVILGRRGEHASWKGFLLGSVVEEVARGCSKPVLVTPREVKPLTKILVAYDGSRTANKALAIAAGLAVDLGLPVTVVSVAADAHFGQGLLEEAETFLEPHKVEVTKVLGKGNVVESILATADRENCDVVIMGAYGHSRVRGLLLGSTTDSILRQAGIPVLLYR